MKIKKCFRYILLVLLICFSFVDNVFADEINYSIDTDYASKDVTMENEETIRVSITSQSNNIHYCWFNVSSSNSEKIEFISANGLNNWNKDDENAGEIRLKNNNSDVDLTAGVNVLSLKYKINDSGKVTISSQCATSLEGEKVSSNTVEIEFNSIDPADDTTVKSILVNGTPLTNFVPDSFNYSAPPLENPNFSLEIETNNPDYQDDIVVKNEAGDILNPADIAFVSNDQGFMLIDIIINNETTYEILFSYEVSNLDSSLSSLKINGDIIRLENGKYNYTYKLSNDATEMRVEAILSDGNNFMFEDGDGIWIYGKNDLAIPIVIKPKSSVVGVGITTYNIFIEKDTVVQEKPSSSNPPKPSTDASTNPQTGNISMFVMAIILIASLAGSIILYKRNIENYNG